MDRQQEQESDNSSEVAYLREDQLRAQHHRPPAIDDAIKIGESTARVAMLKFCEAIINTFKEQYLRDPTTDDLARLLAENKERGFPGMIGSLDCMHWRWDACPVVWRGQYNGRYGYPTLILETAASQDLWIWHAFFGMPGTNNDVTVLDYSPLFNRYMDGTAPPIEYEVNGRQYNLPYYLTDGIYPKHAVFMQAKNNPVTAKERAFTTLQEACRKDIERAFGVLQQKWRILAMPARMRKTSDLLRVMTTCIILHNMIVEDECGHNLPVWTPPIEENQNFPEHEQSVEDVRLLYRIRMGRIRNSETNVRLCDDLINHQWMRSGGENI
ncbi:uncharacterized protein LOC127257638 [Andrographis paniculata]|uniref:uncharacterized protein LOC127257638 n=1 Tax=Andrographis paniculata TaxID=175694 RepID=UPI0021E84717|nr:uncharacterized protein LOC127257638 [Andrographis paniculata]